MEGGRIALRTLNETQGEAVALGPGGKVVLTSEAALGKGGHPHRIGVPRRGSTRR